MKRIGFMFLLTLLILSVTGCSLIDKFKKPSYPMVEEEQPVVVDPNFPVTVNETDILEKPQHVVSLSASIVEQIYDLKLEENLIGVPDFLTYPPSGKKLDACGTGISPDLDVMYELQVDLILTQAPLSQDVMEELKGEHIPVVVIPPATSFQELEENYKLVALALEGKEQGVTVGEETEKELTSWRSGFEKAVSKAKEDSPNILYIRRMPYVVATGDTLEQELFEIAGFKNIAQSEKEWVFDEDSLLVQETRDRFQRLDHLFIDSESMSIEDLEKHEHYRILPAVINDQYTEVDMSIFEHQGFRTFGELKKMAEALYPEAVFPTLGTVVFEEKDTDISLEDDESHLDGEQDVENEDGLSDPEDDITPV